LIEGGQKMIHDDISVFLYVPIQGGKETVGPWNGITYGVGGVLVKYCLSRYHDTLFLLCIYLSG